jgi:adenylate cyclase
VPACGRGPDVLFAEPDRLSPALFAAAASDLAPEIREVLAAQPSNDAILADVLRQTPVVLGVSATHDRNHPYAGRQGLTTPVAEYNGDPRRFLPAYGSVIRSIEALEQAARGRGMITLSPEQDGLVRRVPAVLRVGEVREMTFLFSDIAGFTSLTERTAPEVLVDALNEYLDGMCQIVMDHGGTIDKIVGDAIHAIFNAPIDQPDHAARAVTCALAMGTFSERFAAAKQSAGLPFGGTRIGVNTGAAVIGNFGGRRRFDYTAHGDAINIAARLESVNKHLGTSICVAGSTEAQCPELRFRPIGTIFLKGKTQGIETFEPIDERDGCALKVAAYCAAFTELRQGQAEARESFACLARQHPKDPLIALHAKRSAAGEVGTELVMSDK